MFQRKNDLQPGVDLNLHQVDEFSHLAIKPERIGDAMGWEKDKRFDGEYFINYWRLSWPSR